MVSEAELRQTDAGLVAASPGWFVRNLSEMKWWDRGPRGHVADLVGDDHAQVGANLFVLEPGQPMSMYHWEADQEDFLVLSGEALLIVEDEERPLRQWDFVHCPPETRHAFVGAGDAPCVLLCASSRQFQKDGPWGFYCADETAARYNASSPEDTQNGKLAYARFGPSRETPYRPGLLPE